MTLKTLIAMALAGAFAISTGVLGGGAKHQSRVEVETPSSYSEAGQSMRESPGGTSGRSASGSVGLDASITTSENVEYWRMDEQPSGVGSSSSAGASGSIGFDSSLGSQQD